MAAEWIEGRDPGDERDETPEVAGGEREAEALGADYWRKRVDDMLAASDAPSPVDAAFVLGREYGCAHLLDLDHISNEVERLALLSARPAPEREPTGNATLYRLRCGWCGAYEGTVDPMERCAQDPNTGEYIGPHQFGIYEPARSRPEPVSAPEVAIGCDRCCASAAVYRTPRVSLCYPCLDEILAEYEMRNEAEAVSEPEPGATPVERCGQSIPGSVWRCMLPKGHDQHSVVAPSEPAPGAEPVAGPETCPRCGTRTQMHPLTRGGKPQIAVCPNQACGWDGWMHAASPPSERAGEREALRDALEEAETSLMAVAAHSVQHRMAADARRVLVTIRRALALRGGRAVVTEHEWHVRQSPYGGETWGVFRRYPDGSGTIFKPCGTREDAEAKIAAWMAHGPCRECGGIIDAEFYEHVRAKLLAASLCHSCMGWTETLQTRDDPDTVRVDGVHYRIKPDLTAREPSWLAGFGGRKWHIRFHDGREVISRNLWHRGKIPPHFRDRLPDNAEFVRERER